MSFCIVPTCAFANMHSQICIRTLTKQRESNVEHKKTASKKVQFPRTCFMSHFKEFVWIKRWMALNKNLVLKVWKKYEVIGWNTLQKDSNEYVFRKKENKVRLPTFFFKVRQGWPFSLKSKFIEIECFWKKVSWGYWDEDGQNDLTEDAASAVIATEDVTWENDLKRCCNKVKRELKSRKNSNDFLSSK